MHSSRPSKCPLSTQNTTKQLCSAKPQRRRASARLHRRTATMHLIHVQRGTGSTRAPTFQRLCSFLRSDWGSPPFNGLYFRFRLACYAIHMHGCPLGTIFGCNPSHVTMLRSAASNSFSAATLAHASVIPFLPTPLWASGGSLDGLRELQVSLSRLLTSPLGGVRAAFESSEEKAANNLFL